MTKAEKNIAIRERYENEKQKTSEKGKIAQSWEGRKVNNMCPNKGKAMFPCWKRCVGCSLPCEERDAL